MGVKSKKVMLSNLNHNPDNPRTITDSKLKMLRDSYDKHGDLGGIVYNVRFNRLIGGHQSSTVLSDSEVLIDVRYETPTKKGTVAEGWALLDGERIKYREVDVDERTEEAMNIAANKGAGSWDFPKLTEWFHKLDAHNFNLDLTMWDSIERENLMAPVEAVEGLCEEDEVPDAPKEPITRVGDIYELGKHRILCGDSTSIDDVDKLMDGEKPHLMITDPPYGVKYEAGWRADAKGVKKTQREETSSLSNDDQADWYDAYVLFPGNVAYVWHASSFTDVVMDGLRRAGYRIKQQIIWNKNVHALSRSDYHWKHEPCWYAIKEGSDSHWNGDRTQMTVWDVKNVAFEGDKTNHPTQKPVRIYEISIENNSKINDSIYDPFSGSGSGLIAAEKLGRRLYGMELDPKFCDTIVSRYVKFTGNSEVIRNGEILDWNSERTGD